MWELRYSTQFKKDLKRIKHDQSKIDALQSVLEQLEKSGNVASSYKPHMLSGEYSGCMECHVQNDFLLIWIDADARVINLVRVGSHSELFR